MESLSSKQFFAASVFMVLAISSYMNSSLAATTNKLSSEFITTAVASPNSPTTHDSQINEKAFATEINTISASVPNSPTTHDTRINEKASMASDFPLLRRDLLNGYSHPYAPSPDTSIPDSTNRKASPAPSPEFRLLHRKLLKGYTPPSAPSPDTYIPASTSTLANHKIALAPSPN